MKTFKYTNEDGDEIELDLPTRMEVCDECEGHGFVLCEGMRGHAYTREEFEDSFDDEERGEYFKWGGRYDVPCPTCGGKNVVPVVDEAKLDAEEREFYAAWEEAEDEKGRWAAEDRATERMERGGWG